MSNEHQIIHLLQRAVDQKKKQMIRNLLSKLQGKIPANAVSHVIHNGLKLDPETFSLLVSACETVDVPVFTSVSDGDEKYNVYGTVAIIAAAKGKTEHLKILLDAGANANAASLEIQSRCSSPAVYRGYGSIDEDLLMDAASRTRSLSAAAGCRIKRQSDFTFGGFSIDGCTPLAAAVFFGKTECTELLLEHAEVWIENCSSVASALLCTARKTDPGFAECRRLVYEELKKRELSQGKKIPLYLNEAILNADPELLLKELKRHPYSKDELKRLFENRAFISWSTWAYEQEDRDAFCRRRLMVLTALEKACPDLFHEPEIYRCLLDILASCMDLEGMWDLVIRCTPDELDAGDIHARTAGEYSYLIKRLAGSKKLYMDRDAVHEFVGVTELMAIGRHVRLGAPHPADGGLSGLTAAVLQTGSIRMMRFAEKKGWFSESRELMMKYLSERNIPALRPFVLSLVQEPAEQTEPAQEKYAAHRWYPAEIREDWAGSVYFDIDRVIQADESELDSCIDSLLSKGKNSRLSSITGISVQGINGQYTFYHSIADLLVRQKRVDALKKMISDNPYLLCSSDMEIEVTIGEEERSANPFSGFDSERHKCNIMATALCTAAILGDTELVEAVLAMGADPNEEDHIYCSHLNLLFDNNKAITPYIAARWLGHDDAADLLLKAGALPHDEYINELPLNELLLACEEDKTDAEEDDYDCGDEEEYGSEEYIDF